MHNNHKPATTCGPETGQQSIDCQVLPAATCRWDR